MEQTNSLFYKYMKQTFDDPVKPQTAYIWPEAAINHYYINPTKPKFKKYNRFIARIQEKLPPNSTLITGLRRANIKEKPTFKMITESNGLAVINHHGLSNWYSKHHLVPFSEYMPVLGAFGVPNLLSVVTNTKIIPYKPGNGPAVLDVAGLPPFAPAVCFESIFPQSIVPKNTKQQAAWILVISNDSWYTGTHYPLWLLQMTRMRSI